MNPNKQNTTFLQNKKNQLKSEIEQLKKEKDILIKEVNSGNDIITVQPVVQGEEKIQIKNVKGSKPIKIILNCYLSAGDIVMLTAAVRDLHRAHPGKYITYIDTSCNQIWENNPYIKIYDSKDPEAKGARKIKCDYSLIHRSNISPYHFIHGFRKDLEEKLGVVIPATDFKGDIYISDEEKGWISQVEEMGIKGNYWIMMAGGKYDFTCVAEGSRVQTKEGYKKIEDVTKKDLILTEWGYKKSDGAVFRGEKQCLIVTTKLNKITVTPDHKFKVLSGLGSLEWIEAKDLTPNNYILGIELDKEKLLKFQKTEDLRVANWLRIFEESGGKNWYFDEVIKVENGPVKKVYDILNSETGSFVSEGFCLKNCKWYPSEYYQEVVDHFKGKFHVVQCGEEGHWHPILKDVVNLVGKTDARQFIRLVYNSAGVVCPVTFAMHLAVAIETKGGRPINRPCVVIAGGREPVQWEMYPNHRFLNVNGAMDCCEDGGCWKSRCQKANDGDKKDAEDMCLYPVQVKEDLRFPKCMMMIKPSDIIRAIESYYEGNILNYNKEELPVNVETKALAKINEENKI